MISEDTFRKLQAKTKDIAIDVANKIWENKWFAIPIVILGIGFLKNRGSIKPLSSQQKPSSKNETEQSIGEKTPTIHIGDKKQNKNKANKIQAKLAHSRSFKEEDDASTASQSDKENGDGNPRLTTNTTHRDSYSGYHSDVESIIPEDERRYVKKNLSINSSNPDDLFFSIYQKLK